MITYEVQGRRTDRGDDGKPRDVVRLDTATTSTAAFAIADAMAADALTVWVFETHHDTGPPPSYKLLRVVSATPR